MMDLKTLTAMQGWTLEQKVAHTIDKVSVFIRVVEERGMKPYISFSGGRDSTVMLDIIRRFIDKEYKISTVYCNTGNEWPEIIRFVMSVPNVKIIRPKMKVPEVLSKYGFPLISKEQAQYIRQARTTKSEKLLKKLLYGNTNGNRKVWKIADCWKYLLKVPFCVSEKCCEYLKKQPFAQYKKDTGEVPILGVTADESNQRKMYYIRRGGCNSLLENNLASYPMSIWVEADKQAYIHRYNIPYSSIYDHPGVRQTGCMFCGFGAHLEKGCYSRFELLYDLHPKAYLQFMNYTNNGITYREALRTVGVILPDEHRQLKLF